MDGTELEVVVPAARAGDAESLEVESCDEPIADASSTSAIPTEPADLGILYPSVACTGGGLDYSRARHNAAILKRPAAAPPAAAPAAKRKADPEAEAQAGPSPKSDPTEQKCTSKVLEVMQSQRALDGLYEIVLRECTDVERCVDNARHAVTLTELREYKKCFFKIKLRGGKCLAHVSVRQFGEHSRNISEFLVHCGRKGHSKSDIQMFKAYIARQFA